MGLHSLSINSGKIVWVIDAHIAVCFLSRDVFTCGRFVSYNCSNGKCGWCTDSCPLLGRCLYWECLFVEVLLYG